MFVRVKGVGELKGRPIVRNASRCLNDQNGQSYMYFIQNQTCPAVSARACQILPCLGAGNIFFFLSSLSQTAGRKNVKKEKLTQILSSYVVYEAI